MKCRLSVSGFASGFLRCTGITEVNQSLSVFSPFTKTKSLFFVINKMSLLYSLMNWALSVYKLNLKMMSPIPSVELGMQCPPGYGPQPTPWGQNPQCPPWTAPPQICPPQPCWPPVYYPPCGWYGPNHGHGQGCGRGCGCSRGHGDGRGHHVHGKGHKHKQGHMHNHCHKKGTKCHGVRCCLFINLWKEQIMVSQLYM